MSNAFKYHCPYCLAYKIIYNPEFKRSTYDCGYSLYYGGEPTETPCSKRIYLVVVKEEKESHTITGVFI
jgi:hypothetical protein